MVALETLVLEPRRGAGHLPVPHRDSAVGPGAVRRREGQAGGSAFFEVRLVCGGLCLFWATSFFCFGGGSTCFCLIQFRGGTVFWRVGAVRGL